jgi:hypothetical protein
VRGDFGGVEPERDDHDAVDEGQSAPVVAGVLQAVQEERVRGALAGEGGGHVARLVQLARLAQFARQKRANRLKGKKEEKRIFLRIRKKSRVDECWRPEMPTHSPAEDPIKASCASVVCRMKATEFSEVYAE